MLPIENDYDFLIFDCPTNGYRIKENLYACVDHLILVTIPDNNALQGLMCIATDFVDIKRNYNSALEVLGVLITMKEQTAIKRFMPRHCMNRKFFHAFKQKSEKIPHWLLHAI